MNKQEYQTFRQLLFAELDQLIERKNGDYTSSDDAFSNFREAEDYGVSPLVGIALRMGDKHKRIKSFCKDGKLQVKNESIIDAFKDIIGYSVMACAILEDGKIETLDDILQGIYSEPAPMKNGHRMVDEWIPKVGDKVKIHQKTSGVYGWDDKDVRVSYNKDGIGIITDIYNYGYYAIGGTRDKHIWNFHREDFTKA